MRMSAGVIAGTVGNASDTVMTSPVVVGALDLSFTDHLLSAHDVGIDAARHCYLGH